MFDVHVRRENEQTIQLAVQIPFFAAAEVIHQGAIGCQRRNADVGNAGIHHGGKEKINQAVAAANRHGGNRTHPRQFTELCGVFNACENNAQCVVHQ